MKTMMKHKLALGLLALFWLANTAPAKEFTVANTNGNFRVMTYNIRHAEGRDGKINPNRIADLIKQENADIVALQEVDKGMTRTQRRDLPAELAALTGMTCIFSNNHSIQGGEYGNAILTRFPVLSATNLHYRRVQEVETRGLLQVTLTVHGRPLIFMATHLNHSTNDISRWSNLDEIETIIGQSAGQPMVLCGDFNSRPASRIHRRLQNRLDDVWLLVGSGYGYTIPSEKPNRRIDYIWLPKDQSLLPLKTWIPDSDASDHLPVVAELRWK